MVESPAHDDRRRPAHGFTLLELTIVATILTIIAGIGMPQYASALRTARIAKAKHELMTLSNGVDAYMVNNGGRLPLTLHQVGFGGRRDPWGAPYCYFNYQGGCGDGLDWAIEAGIVDPAAVVDSGGGGGGVVPGRIGAPGSRARRGAQEPGIDNALGHGGRALANGHARAAAARLVAGMASIAPGSPTVDVDALAISLSSSATFRVFVGVPPETTRRRDGFMFPLNSDYDLFSLGPNGRTAVSLGQTMARDDVIRANNGGFFGMASEY